MVVVIDGGLFKTVLKLMFKIFGRVLNTPSIDMMICLTNVLLSDKNPDLYLLLKTVVVFHFHWVLCYQSELWKAEIIGYSSIEAV